MWRPELDWWEFALRGTAVYVVLVVLLRVSGKRGIGQIGLLDLVLVLLVANAAQNAMVGADTSLGGGLVAMAVLVGIDWAFNRLGVRAPRLRRLFTSAPALLVLDGEFVTENMRREGVSREEIESQLREHGIDDITQVHSVILEPDGTVSVVPSGAAVFRGRRHIRQLKSH
jgi:uncharacterized membrane protein YcaP (DUF421 family)